MHRLLHATPFVLLSPALAAQGTLFVQPAPTFPASGSPTRARLADLDRDGRPDVVAAGTGSSATSIRLGDGVGGFGALATLPEGGPFAIGDLNGDSIPDLASIDVAGGQLRVRLGDGLGGFGAAVLTAVSLPRSVALGDIDGDGALDAIVGVSGSIPFPPQPHLQRFLGNGLGGLSPLALITDTTGAQDVGLVDLNLDGKLDFFSTALPTPNFMTTRLGDGAGGFAAPFHLDVAGGFTACVLDGFGDANGDGKPDVLTSQHLDVMFNDLARVLIGSGTGTLSLGASNFEGQPTHFALGDVTGDAKTDLLRTSVALGKVSVLAGDGSGGFGAPDPYVAGAAPVAVALGDLDGDGRLDAVVTGGGALSVLKSQVPPATGTAPYGIGTAGCSGVHGIAAASAPSVGNAAFALVNTGTPASSLGLLIIGDVADVPGSDPFQIGCKEHIDLFASTLLLGFNFLGDFTGFGVCPVPIPPSPSLAGATVYAQGVWLWDDCAPSPFHLSKSRGLSITIQ